MANDDTKRKLREIATRNELVLDELTENLQVTDALHEAFALGREVGNAARQDLVKAGMQLGLEIAQLRAQVAALEAANMSVAVCAKHTAEVTRDGCLVCDADAAEVQVVALEKEHTRFRDELGTTLGSLHAKQAEATSQMLRAIAAESLAAKRGEALEKIKGHHHKECNLSQTFGFCVSNCPDRIARAGLTPVEV